MIRVLTFSVILPILIITENLSILVFACRNKLKEEITANTVQKVMGIQVVSPVKHVSRVKRDRNEAQDGGRNFYQALEKAKEKRDENKYNGAEMSAEHALERMGGLNQYDRHAREIFFAMSSNADFKC